MKFHIVSIAPQGYRFGHFLDDTCKLLCHGLESLGHDCSLGLNNIETSRVNVLVGAHLLSAPADAQAIAASGAKYIVVQSEVIGPDGVNLSGNRQQYTQVYLPLLQRAVAAWDGTPEHLPYLTQLGVQAHLLRCGYHPALEEIRAKNRRDIDFLFYGSITPHRRTMLQALQQRGHQVAAIFDPRAMFRNDLIARTKVQLSPRQGERMDHLPYGRIGYLLNNRQLVCVERCRGQEWLEHCFASEDTTGWLDLCEQLLRATDRERQAEEYYELYRAMPYISQLGPVVEATLAARELAVASQPAPTGHPAPHSVGHAATIAPPLQEPFPQETGASAAASVPQPH